MIKKNLVIGEENLHKSTYKSLSPEDQKSIDFAVGLRDDDFMRDYIIKHQTDKSGKKLIGESWGVKNWNEVKNDKSARGEARRKYVEGKLKSIKYRQKKV